MCNNTVKKSKAPQNGIDMARPYRCKLRCRKNWFCEGISSKACQTWLDMSQAFDTYVEVWKEFQFFVGGTSSTWYCSQCLLQVLWMQKGVSNIHTHVWYTNHESTSLKQSNTRHNEQLNAQPSAWRWHDVIPPVVSEDHHRVRTKVCKRDSLHIVWKLAFRGWITACFHTYDGAQFPSEIMRDHAFCHCCIRTRLISWPCLIMKSDITMPCLDQLAFAMSSQSTKRRPDQSWSDCAVGDCVGEPMPTTTGAACSNTKADSRVEPATCILSFKIPARVHSVSIVNTERNRG